MKQLTLGTCTLSFGFFLLANPAFFTGCSAEADFEYDEADMLEVVEDLNEATDLRLKNANTGAEHLELSFQVEQSTEGDASAQLAPLSNEWIKAAHACGSRSFVKDAHACIDVSRMPLEGTLNFLDEGEVVHTVSLKGEMAVYSRLLTQAEFSFQYEGGTLMLKWHDDDEPWRDLEASSASNLLGERYQPASGVGGAGGAGGSFGDEY